MRACPDLGGVTSSSPEASLTRARRTDRTPDARFTSSQRRPRSSERRKPVCIPSRNSVRYISFGDRARTWRAPPQSSVLASYRWARGGSTTAATFRGTSPRRTAAVQCAGQDPVNVQYRTGRERLSPGALAPEQGRFHSFHVPGGQTVQPDAADGRHQIPADVVPGIPATSVG